MNFMSQLKDSDDYLILDVSLEDREKLERLIPEDKIHLGLRNNIKIYRNIGWFSSLGGRLISTKYEKTKYLREYKNGKIITIEKFLDLLKYNHKPIDLKKIEELLMSFDNI